MQQQPFSYRTIAKPAEGLYREKGSRFIAFAYPVNSEAEVKEHLGSLHKKYFDARHHCFAWIRGTSSRTFRAFDDGEPNHSAGDPILGQIRSRDLTNVLVVVVRYFGGIKLGVGGLAAAYKTAAEEALNAAEIVEREMKESITIVYDYAATPEVMRIVKDYEFDITLQKFEAEGELVADYPLRHREKLLERLALMQATGVKLRLS